MVAIYDTHGKYRNLILLKGDMLFHAGDVSLLGKESEIYDFFKLVCDNRYYI